MNLIKIIYESNQTEWNQWTQKWEFDNLIL